METVGYVLSETGHGQEGYMYMIYIYVHTHIYIYMSHIFSDSVSCSSCLQIFEFFFDDIVCRCQQQTYRSASRLSLDGRKYISAVSNSTYEHNGFFYLPLELNLVLC